MLLGVQQRCVEAGREAGGGKDLLEWDLGFPQEPEKTKKSKGENQPNVPVSSISSTAQLESLYLGPPVPSQAFKVSLYPWYHECHVPMQDSSHGSILGRRERSETPALPFPKLDLNLFLSGLKGLAMLLHCVGEDSLQIDYLFIIYLFVYLIT